MLISKKVDCILGAKFRDIDGGVPDEEIVFPVNHLLQSMWKQVEVFLGGKLVSSGSSNYHYKSMIKTLLYQCQNEGVKKQLCSELFYEDMEGAT